MSMVPLGGILGSVAGGPLSQSAGSEAERAQRESSAQRGHVDGDQRAERAAGIGQTEHDQESTERDADGRRLWEQTKHLAQADGSQGESAAAGLGRQSRDSTGQSGTRLDLTG